MSLPGGFTFGQPSQSAPATATVNPLNTGTGFNFGNTGQNQNTGSGLSFGQAAGLPTTLGGVIGQVSSPASSTGINFGFPASSSSSGFTFGQPSSPATSATGLSGLLGHTSQPSIGTGGLFGQTSQPSTGTGGLSGQSNQSSGLFGQTIQGVPNPGGLFSPTNFAGINTGGLFGQTSQPSLLGQPPTQAALSTGGLFGQTSQSSANTGGLFGQTSLSGTGTGGLFGQSSQATSVTGGLLGQGSQSTAGTGSLFGQGTLSPSGTGGLLGQSIQQPTSLGGGLFSQTSTPAPTTGGLFGQNSQVLPATTASTGLFSPPTTPSSIAGGLFGTNQTSPLFSGLTGQLSNFNASVGSAPAVTTSLFSQTSQSGGLFSSPASSTSVSQTSGYGLGGSFSPSLSTTLTGLGGFQPPAIDTVSGSSTSKGDGKCIKETPLPQDIFATISIFESYKDIEKKASEENIRQTATPFHKLCDDTKKLRQHIVKLANQHAQLHASARKLKTSVIQEAENVEMARRTQDTPMSLQGDNKAPEEFFLRLVRSFEERMTYCRSKIEEVEKCSQTNGGLSEITSEDMKQVLKKEHEMVKVLAAKVYTLHNQLINHCCKHSNPALPQPEALFKPASIDESDTIGIGHKNSSVLRPCFGEGGSGLLNFQTGQQRAKAFSLGAAPPTLSLGHTSMPSILGSSNQPGLFGSSSNMFGSPTMNFGSGSGSLTPSFSFNKSATDGSSTLFGASNNTSSSIYGNTSFGNSAVSNMGNFSSFNSPKTFGKSSLDHEESHRKRRM